MNKNLNVLVISNCAFSKLANNGKTYENILGAFGKENLAQLFFRPQRNDIDFDYCSNYYLVSEVDIINKLLLRSKSCGRKLESSECVKQQSNAYGVKPNSIKRNPLLRDLLWKTNLWKTDELRNWCRELDADLIFFVGAGQGFAYDIALYVADYLNLPLVIYFTDDYLISPKCRNFLERIQHNRMRSFYSKAINRAKLHFCIGEMMAEAYSQYFKKTFLYIMNSSEILPFHPISYGKEIRISYFGGLHLNRWEMIARFARLVSERVLIHVYTFTPITDVIKKAFDESGVILHKGLQGTDLYKAMNESHVLLHVESDDSYNRSLTKLSVSTKIPEYLMQGRLVIGFGPQEVASLRLLSDNKIGIVLSSSDDDNKLKGYLSNILSDCALMANMGKKAHAYAIANFDKEKTVVDLYRQLCSVVEDNSNHNK